MGSVAQGTADAEGSMSACCWAVVVRSLMSERLRSAVEPYA